MLDMFAMEIVYCLKIQVKSEGSRDKRDLLIAAGEKYDCQKFRGYFRKGKDDQNNISEPAQQYRSLDHQRLQLHPTPLTIFPRTMKTPTSPTSIKTKKNDAKIAKSNQPSGILATVHTHALRQVLRR